MSRAADLYEQSGIPEEKRKTKKVWLRIEELWSKGHQTWTAEEKREFHALADEYCERVHASIVKTIEWAKELH